MRLTFLSKLNTLWLRTFYPFATFGERVSIHYSCDVAKWMSKAMSIGDDVYVAPDVWLNVVSASAGEAPKIILSKGCKIGRRSTISARNYIALGENVLLAPAVLIMDHNHEYSNPAIPIHAQGVTDGGRITIERNCWLGYGAVISCGKGELTLGRNSVVGAGAVVMKSFPPYSVIAGNPARLVKYYDESCGQWIRTENSARDVDTQ